MTEIEVWVEKFSDYFEICEEKRIIYQIIDKVRVYKTEIGGPLSDYKFIFQLSNEEMGIITKISTEISNFRIDDKNSWLRRRFVDIMCEIEDA